MRHSTGKAALKSRMKTVSYCIASSSLVFHTKNRLIRVSQLQILSWACCSLCLQHLVRTNFPKSHPQLQALHKAPVYIASCFPVVYPQLLDLHKASVTSPTFSPQTAFISNYVCIQPYGVGAIALWHHHCRLVTTAKQWYKACGLLWYPLPKATSIYIESFHLQLSCE